MFRDDEEEFFIRKQPRKSHPAKKKHYSSDSEPRIHLVENNKNGKHLGSVTKSCRNVHPSRVLDEFAQLDIDSFEKRRR